MFTSSVTSRHVTAERVNQRWWLCCSTERWPAGPPTWSIIHTYPHAVFVLLMNSNELLGYSNNELLGWPSPILDALHQGCSEYSGSSLFRAQILENLKKNKENGNLYPSYLSSSSHEFCNLKLRCIEIFEHFRQHFVSFQSVVVLQTWLTNQTSVYFWPPYSSQLFPVSVKYSVLDKILYKSTRYLSSEHLDSHSPNGH